MKPKFLNYTSLLFGLVLLFISISAISCVEKNDSRLSQPYIAYDSSTSDDVVVGIANSDIEPTRILHITDSHITFAGPEDEEFAKYSSRMAAAYENGSHYKTGEQISRTEAFTSILRDAKGLGVDLILLTGDILNYPSKRAVEFVLNELDACGIPFLYTAGNHDWHLEGLPGSSYDLREEWRESILDPLYQGENSSHSARIINGINFLMIDNSTYQMTSEQLDFIRKQKALNLPMVIGTHIPISVAGEPGSIGSRDWGAATDVSYEIEGRERWPAEGHNQETFDFVDELIDAPISIVLCGHIHIARTDRKGGLLQFITPMARYGHYRIVDIIPADETN